MSLVVGELNPWGLLRGEAKGPACRRETAGLTEFVGPGDAWSAKAPLDEAIHDSEVVTPGRDEVRSHGTERPLTNFGSQPWPDTQDL